MNFIWQMAAVALVLAAMSVASAALMILVFALKGSWLLLILGICAWAALTSLVFR